MIYKILMALVHFFVKPPSEEQIRDQKEDEAISNLADGIRDTKVAVIENKKKAIYHQKMAEYNQEVLNLPELKQLANELGV